MPTEYPYSDHAARPNFSAVTEAIEQSAMVDKDIYNMGYDSDTLVYIVRMISDLSTPDEAILDLIVATHADDPQGDAPPLVVHVEEEDPDNKTGGHLQGGAVCLDSATLGYTDNWMELDVVYPHAIAILSAVACTTAAANGDQWEVLVGPDTVIGLTTAAVAIDDTEISLAAATIAYLELGYRLAVGGEDLGRVVAIGATSVTVENAATQAHASGVSAAMTVYYVYDYMLLSGIEVNIGRDKIGGSYIPADTTIRIRYRSADASATVFHVRWELLY